jgi:hypothetical protein
VEKLYRLPNEYSEVVDDESYSEIDGDDVDLQSIESFTDLNDSNAYKMIGEEVIAENDNSNAQVTNAEVSMPNISKSAENEEEIKEDSNKQNTENKKVKPQDIDISALIKDLDNKILELETTLKSTTNNITNNNIEQTNSTNPEYQNTDLVNNSYNINNNEQVKNIKNIIQQINELKDLKKSYENTLLTSNNLSENVYNDSGIVRYDNFTNSIFEEQDNTKNENVFTNKDTAFSSQKNNIENKSNVFNNFTPNLKIDSEDSITDTETSDTLKKDKERATDRAIATERAMGGDPIVEVVPGIGEVVIDNNSQDSFSDAVQQHGGLNDALSDSITSQENFYNNKNIEEKSFVEQGNIDNSFFNTSNKNEEFSTTSQDNLIEDLPNYNADLLKSSNDSLAILTNISKQLVSINKNLGKSFNNLNNSIKDIKTTQQNTYYQNNSNSPSSNSTSSSNVGKSDPNLIPEIRGDKPLTEDFPKNFNMDDLFSNLRP